MRIVADFHLHSKYSRATSRDMDLEHIAKFAKYKGINLVGSGDFTHPFWFSQLKEKLQELDSGFLKLKKGNGPYFILTAEISNIFTQNGKVRKIHTILLAPSFETVAKINERLTSLGNLYADGRPIFGLPIYDLAALILEIDSRCVLVPAHAWTPWFSIFGSNSGFDSIEECFGKLSDQIYAIETGLSCYDEETEVLTEGGWKKFSHVTQEDKFCTLNVDTEEIEYQKPQKIYKSRYRGKMYRLKTKRVDLFVTPNHNLLYAPADFRTPRRFRLKEASKLFGRSKILRKDGIWKGDMPRYFTLPKVTMRHGSKWHSGFRVKSAKKLPIKPWLKFFGFWIAEGWASEGKDGDYNVCLAVQKSSLKAEMLKIIKELNYNPYSDDKIIRVRDYQLFSYLKQFGRASQKYVPLEVKRLSKELLVLFLDYYLQGDGHIYGRSGKGRSATTISTRLRDDLQEIALKTGDSAYYKLHYKKGTPFPALSQRKEYEQSTDSWNIYFIRRNRHTIIPSEMKKYGRKEGWVMDYDGVVYCVSVPNRTVYIRRNGIPLWCGNSDPPMNWRLSALDKISLISCSDAHSPQNIGRELTVFELENPSYDEIIESLKTKNPKKLLYTVEFFPEEGKYHFDGHRVCNVSFSPEKSKAHNNICPVCHKPLTIGVLHRVDDLADRQEVIKPEIFPGFKSLVGLLEIIAESIGQVKTSQKVLQEYLKLVNFYGSEFQILVDLPLEKLSQISPKILEGIKLVRQGKVKVEPGYDGVYGKVQVFSKVEAPLQGSLF